MIVCHCKYIARKHTARVDQITTNTSEQEVDDSTSTTTPCYYFNSSIISVERGCSDSLKSYKGCCKTKSRPCLERLSIFSLDYNPGVFDVVCSFRVIIVYIAQTKFF